MFFGLVAVDHPCCKMQNVVEAFFLNATKADAYSLGLFPQWIRPTLRNGKCALGGKFSNVFALLHADEMTEDIRRSICEQLRLTNRIEELCEGTMHIPNNVIDWKSALGIAIADLMLALYDALDLAVFRKTGHTGKSTHQLYSAFIAKNKYVCPFCGLDIFKNRRGPRRQDFDHYLHKSAYPLAAANLKNLVPTCGTCNQDYKKVQDILANGSAFYPYAAIPKVRLEIDCTAYPATNNFDDSGSWSVKLELVNPDAAVAPKMTAWNRVYSIKQRIENAIQEYFEEWMTEVSDDYPHTVDEVEFVRLITSARGKAKERAQRRMEPCQIVKEAFYDFVLTKARSPFVESFRRLRNERYN